MNAWLQRMLAQDAPSLPLAWAMQLDLSLGWALVLALLGSTLAWRLPLPQRRLVALVLAVWALLPGPLSPDYWLGLAFHAPSLTAMLLCAGLVQRLLFPAGLRRSWPRDGASAAARLPAGSLGLLAVGVLLGYALLLDTFALLPLSLYAWGFSPLALLLLLALFLLPWVAGAARERPHALSHWLAPLALLLFAATRLPTGNVWDALLDPWLWLLMHGLLLRQLWRRWQVGR